MRTLENALRRFGFCRIAGVDEVGRGCLAGPVVAGRPLVWLLVLAALIALLVLGRSGTARKNKALKPEGAKS